MKLAEVKGRASAAALRAVAGDRRLLSFIAGAVGLRLAMMPWFSDPYNFHVLSQTASMVASGQNPWLAIAADPALAQLNPWGYPPLYLTPVLAASALSFGNGVVFGILLRLPLIAATVLTAVFLQRTALGLGLSSARARSLSLFYLLNPFVVLVDTVWGVNDPLPVVCVAGALYYMVRAPQRLDLAALLLGLGIAFKLYPVVLLPVACAQCTSWKARLRLLAFAALPAAISAGPVLLASPSEFLSTLGVFVSGRGGEPSAFTIPYVLEAAGFGSLPLGTALAAADLVLVLFVALRVAAGKWSTVEGFAITLLSIFIFAPRMYENYFLWPIPAALVAYAAAQRWWPARRAVPWTWALAMASALIYNGAGDTTDLAYWTLVAGAGPSRPYLAAPENTGAAFSFVALIIFGLAMVGLLRAPSKVESGADARTPLKAFSGALSRLPAGRRVLALGAVLMLVSAAWVVSLDRRVGPEDFPTFHFADGRVSIDEEFHSAFLDNTWVFGGAGGFELSPYGAGTLTLETRVPRGNAYISRALPNTTVRADILVRVDRVDGTPGLLMLARTDAGWVGAKNVTSDPQQPRYNLSFFDDSIRLLFDLGEITLGSWLSLRLTVNSSKTVLTFGAATVSGGGAPPSTLSFGHPDAGLNLGGRLTFDRIELSWEQQPSSSAPILAPALIILGVLTMVVLFEWWRRMTT